MIPLCIEAGVSLVPYSPLARGLLAATRRREGRTTERAATDHFPGGGGARHDFDTVDKLVAMAWAKGVKPSQLALAWLMHKPYVAAPGSASPGPSISVMPWRQPRSAFRRRDRHARGGLRLQAAALSGRRAGFPSDRAEAASKRRSSGLSRRMPRFRPGWRCRDDFPPPSFAD
jgi:hypothetical protein